MTQIVEHHSTNPAFRERLALNSARGIESIDALNQSDHAGGDQIVDRDARRDAALEVSRDKVDLVDLAENGDLARGMDRHSQWRMGGLLDSL